MNKSATILTHPRFDRPRVKNPALRGGQIGVSSLITTRGDRATQKPPRSPSNDFVTYLCEGVSAHVGGASSPLQALNTVWLLMGEVLEKMDGEL